MRSPILAPSLAVALAGVASCTSSGGAQLGAACSSKTPCASGEVCDLTNPGGAICIDANGDLDGDGIPNNKDFCNHMPGGAFDEDGDGIGDECDACPIAKPPAKPDGDGDAVDSPCDPDPSTPGDKITVFNGFNGALPTGWTATAGWSFSGGEAVLTPTDPNAVEQITVKLTTPANHVSILAAYRIDATPSAVMTDAGVVGLTHLPLGDTIDKCGANRAIGDALQVQTNSGISTAPAQNLFDPTDHYRLLNQVDGANVNCAVVGSHENQVKQSPSNGDPISEVGIYARGATMRFAYLLVIQR